MNIFDWFREHEKRFSPELNGFNELPINQYLSILPLISSTPKTMSQKWLDLGCGNGMLLKFLCDYSGAQINPYGVELNSGSYEAIKEVFPDMPDNFSLGDVNAYEFPQNSLDGIIMNPCYAPRLERRKFIDRAIEHLNPGGRLICLIQNDALRRWKVEPGNQDLGKIVEARYDAKGLPFRYSYGTKIAFAVYDNPL
jgi:SAM-dependent methyltransferase